MTEQELQKYLIKQHPKEDEGCEWKEFKNLKNDVNGHEKDDVISYVSALVNMNKKDSLDSYLRGLPIPKMKIFVLLCNQNNKQLNHSL